MLDFGRRILGLRKAAGLTQEQLAERLEVSNQTISVYENNGKLPSFETIRRMANVFGVSADYILGLEESPSISTRGLNEMQINALTGLVRCYLERRK